LRPPSGETGVSRVGPVGRRGDEVHMGDWYGRADRRTPRPSPNRGRPFPAVARRARTGARAVPRRAAARLTGRSAPAAHRRTRHVRSG